MRFWWVTALLAACVSAPDFEPASLVGGPRVMAIVADPPSVAPGGASELTLMLAEFGDPADYSITWSACGAFFSDIRGSQYGAGPESQGCGGGPAFPLGEGPVATLPGEQTAALFASLDTVAAIVGSDLPEGTVEAIEQEVGLPLLVEARISLGDQVHRAAKRVLVDRNGSFENPPPVRFSIDGQLVSAQSGDDPFECAAVAGEVVEVQAGSQVELVPRMGAQQPDESGCVGPARDGEDPEPWLEQYTVLNARGELEMRTERAFYSWFASGGEFERRVTKSPLRDQSWRAPAVPGDHHLWLVVRDGHGGTSPCRVPVRVVAAAPRPGPCAGN